MIWWVVVLAVSSLWSAPLGNPASPRALQRGIWTSDAWNGDLRVGYEGDFVLAGKMKQVSEGVGAVDRYVVTTNSGTITGNFLQRLDLFAVLGESQVESAWRFANLLRQVRDVQMETRVGFLWALGGRVIAVQHGPWSLGFGGRYSQINSPLKRLSVDGMSTEVASSSFCNQLWEIEFGVSYRIRIFIPYVGVDYLQSYSRVLDASLPIAPDGAYWNHFRNKVPVGLYLGCLLSSGSYFFFNLEARLVNEEAVTVTGEVRF